MTTVAFIGLGIMGSRMAACLHAAGFELTVFNRTRERAEEWVAATPDADRACFHVVAEAGDKERARALAEEFRDKIAGWRRDTA